MQLTPPSATLDLTVDYDASELAVFRRITKTYITSYRTLNVFVDLEIEISEADRHRTAFQRYTTHPNLWTRLYGTSFYASVCVPSWVCFWDPTQNKCPREPFSEGGLGRQKVPDEAGVVNGSYERLSGQYCAAGGKPAITNCYLADEDVIRAQGFTADTIEVVGKMFPFRCKEAVRLSILYGKVVTANARSERRAPEATWSIFGDSDSDTDTALRETCQGRRFFKTKKGRWGIGNCNLVIGDSICVLFGSDVPLILGYANHRGPLWYHEGECRRGCNRLKHIDCCIPELHRIVGQAYVEGLMQYEGNIDEDIATGEVEVKDFFLE
ncbi:hypothetical protein LTS18_004407 [Coniosporium uncinatum]|uniref:Uncharacterized protein n=1 Tax=Coniosporium uncinatum TaxID=93489 RepID=A0ACC3D5R0_9PEZI|nr:hypothetical protein LTS18_004407 [Coniosporium uncinatum]